MNSNVRLAVTLACALSGILPVIDAHAHGGGLNADGCHTNRKTGDYHCHRPATKVSDSFNVNRTANHLVAPGSDSRSGARQTGSFANCAQARAAGAAPVRIGDAGYGAHLDRDGDGIGCEPYRGRR